MPKEKKRECNLCTACCDGWLDISIEGIHVSEGAPCPHSVNNRCAIYEKRPNIPCKTFICGWLSESNLFPDWLTPDNSKAILLLNRKWQGYTVLVAIPVGRRIPQRTINWLKEFWENNNQPVIYLERGKKNGQFINKKIIYGFGPPVFVELINKWRASGLEPTLSG